MGYMFEAIIKLWKDGKSKREINRTVNHDIKTVRKIIKLYEKESVTHLSYKRRTGLLDGLHQSIQELVEQSQ